MNEAQHDHFRLLKDIDIVILLSSMLPSIAVENMIPSRVLTICHMLAEKLTTK